MQEVEEIKLLVGSWPWALYKLSQSLMVKCKELEESQYLCMDTDGDIYIGDIDDEVDNERICDYIKATEKKWFIFDIEEAKKDQINEELLELEKKRNYLLLKLAKP